MTAATHSRREIWDGCLVNDEIELLTERLRYLSPVVDRFVVVEANRTFAGQPKPLHVEEALRGHLAPFAGQIVHVVADLPAATKSPWEREIAQRDALYGALLRHPPRDAIVTVCDVDEVPFAGALLEASAGYDGARMLVMQHAVLFANWRLAAPWRRAFLATPVDVKAGAERLAEPGGSLPDVTPGGWHLSFLGGPEMIRSKLASYSHQEFNTDRMTRESFLLECFAVGLIPTTRQLLTPQEPGDAGDLVAGLQANRPDYIGPALLPSRRRRKAFRAWATVRSRRWVPDRLVAWLDVRPRLSYALGHLFMLPVELLQPARD
jgi:beta-1,4-mannosyl-glycoprotein beta-1,4-N-acetylglucosaminyltransferase